MLLAGATGAAAAVSVMAGSYLDAAAARATAETIGAAEMGRACDVLSEVALAGLVDAAPARFARSDILVNIAGPRHPPAC